MAIATRTFAATIFDPVGAPIAESPNRLLAALRGVAQQCFFTVVVRPFVHAVLGLRILGRENLPPTDPFILVSNHASHLDAVVLLSLFHGRRLRRIHPAAAADYFRRSRLLFWLTSTFFNILPIERKHITRSNDPCRVMQAALEAGESLIVFPEGTRGSGNELQAFHAGIAHLARREPGVPVIPAHLTNTGRSLPKGTWVPLPLLCEVRIGGRLHLQGSPGEASRDLAAAVRALETVS